MKNKLLFPLLMMLSLSVVSCGEKSKKISMFFYNENDTFIKSLSEKLVNKIINYIPDYKTYFADNSQVSQNGQIITELNNETSLLIVNTVDRLASSALIEKSNITKTPLIFVNREPLTEDLLRGHNVYYVGSDATEQGREQARIVNKLFGNKTNFANSKFDKNKDGVVQVVLLKGEQGHQDAEQRSMYCIDQLKTLGYKVEVLCSAFANWNREEAKSKMTEIYKEYGGEIELIFSNNDDMGIGVIDYLKSLKEYNPKLSIVDQYFPVIGVDATKVGLDSIQNDELYGTVENDADEQVEVIYKLAYYLLEELDFTNFPYAFDGYCSIHVKGKGITKITNQ
ncbi:MAG: galactose ABC transporter substrate-binding protein [Bacilli bacterium]